MRLQAPTEAMKKAAHEAAIQKERADAADDEEWKEEDNAMNVRALNHVAPATVRRLKAGRAPMLTGSSIEMLSRPPRMYCSIQRNPCRYRSYGVHRQIAAVWEFQFDARNWIANPRGLVNLVGDNPSSTMSILKTLWLAGYLIQTVPEPKKEPQVDADTGKTSLQVVDSTSSLKVYWECVPHRDDPAVFVAYRLRIIEFGDPSSGHGLSSTLHRLLFANQQARAKLRSHGSFKPKYPVGPECYSNLSMASYMDMCRSHRPALILEAANCPEQYMNNIFSRECPFRPENAFDPAENRRTARALKADPRYCDDHALDQYDAFDNYGEIFAEDGKNAWELTPASLDPANLQEMWMPHRRPPIDSFPKEKAQFGEMYGIRDQAALDFAFNATRNTSSERQPANDMDEFTRRVKTEDDALRSKHKIPQPPRNATAEETLAYAKSDGVKHEYHSERLQLARKSWMTLFGEVICPTGDCPPSMQIIANHKDHFLLANENKIAVPQESVFSNLTRFQDQRANEAIMMDQVVTSKENQADCLFFAYSTLHVYARVPMNLHHLLLGPPGIGKSFALLLLTKLLIEGTWRNYTYVTAKALSAPGKMNACLVLIFEDAAPSMLGADGGTAKNAAATDQQAMMKAFLTSMELAIGAVTMEPKRAVEHIKCETGCIAFFAMNESSSQFPPPVLDRFVVSVSSEEITNTVSSASGNDDDSAADASANSMMAKTKRSKDDAVREAMSMLQVAWVRRQILAAYIFHLESAGVLRRINLSATDHFVAVLTDVAKQRQLNLDRHRPIERFRMLVRVFVVLNAIDLLWDCPDSPLRNKEFEMTDFLYADKYLVASLQMGVFAMGMVGRQWQDNLRASIISAMKKHFYPDADVNIKAYKRLPPLDRDGSDPLLMQLAANAPQPPPHYSLFQTEADKGKPGRAKKGGKGGGGGGDHETQAYQRERLIHERMMESTKYWMYDTCVIGGPQLAEMSNSGNKNPTKEEVIAHVASKLTPHLASKFLPREITGKLMAMLDETVVVKRRKRGKYSDDMVTTEVSQLMLDGNCIRMAYPTLELADDGEHALFKCVQEVVTILYVMGQPPPGSGLPSFEGHAQFMYGETIANKAGRFVWRMVYADKDKAKAIIANPARRAAVCRIYNPAFAEESVQVVVQTVMKSWDPDWYGEHARRRFFDAATPFTEFNSNLDELAADERAHQLGLSYDDQHTMRPSNDCTISDVKYREHFSDLAASRKSTLLHYPSCFKGLNAKQFQAMWKGRAHRHPEMFQSQTRLENFKRLQKERPSLFYVDPNNVPVAMDIIGVAEEEEDGPPQLEREEPHRNLHIDAPSHHAVDEGSDDDDDRRDDDDGDFNQYDEDAYAEAQAV